MIIVPLEKEEVEQVRAWAVQRTEENKGHSDIPEYDHRRFYLTPLQNNILGLAAEVAVCKFLGLDYMDQDVYLGFVPRERYAELKQPDIAGRYEVRSVRKPDNPLAIRTKDVKAKAIVVHTYVPHSLKTGWEKKVHINGWVSAEAGWTFGTEPSWGKGDSRVIPVRSLLDPNELLRGSAA